MATPDEKRPSIGRKTSIDAGIAARATRQHGVVALNQLVSAGLSPRAVRARIAVGGLHRIHRGVYSIVPPALLGTRGIWMAAVLACGPEASLSHLACAALHRVRPAPVAIDVSIPRPGGCARPGIRIHRVRPFDPRDHGTLDGIPCTSLPRTLLDIAPLIGRRGVELAIAEAQHRRAYDRGALVDLVGRADGLAGVRVLRSILDDHGIERTLTNRGLEERFLALVRRAGLPIPLVNEWIPVGTHSFECDFVWKDARLIVETDGRDSHTRELQFEEDRRRDAMLKLAGWEVIRFTWKQVTREPEWVASMVRRFLDRRLAA